MTLLPSSAYGTLNNGWEKINGSWYYYENGNSISGWKYDDKNWYYLNNDGVMKTGWIKDVGDWYYLNDDGSMGKGWKFINNQWYYLQNNGAMKTGWLNDNDTWYYLNSNGSMAHDTVIDGYTLNSNGVYIENKKNYTFTEGLNKFCLDSGAMILANEDKKLNTSYSPLSFYMAIAVLSEGSDNNTKTEILNALNVNDEEKLSEECRKLYEKESFDSKYGKCTLADSIWIDDDNNDVKFNEDTLKKIENDYNAGIFKGDLQSFNTAKDISNWLLEHTGGLLGGNPSDFISDEGAVMNIINSVYFKDKWADVFNRNLTEEKDFCLSDGSKVKSDFMANNIYSKIYESNNGYKSSSLKFKNGNEMIFILPDKGTSVYDVINDKNKFNEALNSLSDKNVIMEDVHYKVPKFKVSSKLDLNNCAKTLGLENIFNGKTADFSKFSEKGGLAVSSISQEATVSIDEDGGEAAAYTEIEMDGGAYDPEAKSYDMTLDRPFIFAITDKDNTPLFLGVINNPTV